MIVYLLLYTMKIISYCFFKKNQQIFDNFLQILTMKIISCFFAKFSHASYSCQLASSQDSTSNTNIGKYWHLENCLGSVTPLCRKTSWVHHPDNPYPVWVLPNTPHMVVTISTIWVKENPRFVRDLSRPVRTVSLCNRLATDLLVSWYQGQILMCNISLSDETLVRLARASDQINYLIIWHKCCRWSDHIWTEYLYISTFPGKLLPVQRAEVHLQKLVCLPATAGGVVWWVG